MKKLILIMILSAGFVGEMKAPKPFPFSDVCEYSPVYEGDEAVTKILLDCCYFFILMLGLEQYTGSKYVASALVAPWVFLNIMTRHILLVDNIVDSDLYGARPIIEPIGLLFLACAAYYVKKKKRRVLVPVD